MTNGISSNVYIQKNTIDEFVLLFKTHTEKSDR